MQLSISAPKLASFVPGKNTESSPKGTGLAKLSGQILKLYKVGSPTKNLFSCLLLLAGFSITQNLHLCIK